MLRYSIGPGGAGGEQVESRSAEVDETHDNDGDGSYSTQGLLRYDSSECDVKMNVSHHDMGQGGQVGVLDRLNDIQGNWSHENNGYSVVYDRRGCWMDDTASSTHCNSK